MARDPAFLFYDGDASRDVSHMNRLERGCYFDLLQAQRKFGGYTAEQARKILGKDFDECWPALEMILSKTEDGIYFIEWVAESTKKRKKHSQIQSDRIKEYWRKKKESEEIEPVPRLNHGISKPIPLENEIENILLLIKNGSIVEEGVDEKIFAMVVLKMIEIFKRHFPKYPVNKEFDYPACLNIAYKIADFKGWKKFDVVNGQMKNCLQSWETIVQFAAKDDWLSTRSIADIGSDKEWPRLIQKMTKRKKKPEETSDAPLLDRL